MLTFRISYSLLLVLCVSQVQTLACTVCIGSPEQTAIDGLVSANCVVLAHNSESDAFTFMPREVLAGQFDGNPIDLLVDTTTRRRLSNDPERSVILVQDDESKNWRNLGIASEQFHSVVRRIVWFSVDWKTQGGRNRRAEFFYSIFGDPDPSVHELAYLEMGVPPIQCSSGLASPSMSSTCYPCWAM